MGFGALLAISRLQAKILIIAFLRNNVFECALNKIRSMYFE